MCAAARISALSYFQWVESHPPSPLCKEAFLKAPTNDNAQNFGYSYPSFLFSSFSLCTVCTQGFAAAASAVFLWPQAFEELQSIGMHEVLCSTSPSNLTQADVLCCYFFVDRLRHRKQSFSRTPPEKMWWPASAPLSPWRRCLPDGPTSSTSSTSTRSS